MDREKATEIHQMLLDVVEAYNRAEFAVWDLERDDRVAFATALGAVSEALHWELLPVIYKQYPDLRPPDKAPFIVSTLRWEQVRLPPSVSEADLDGIIFSLLKTRSQKTAAVILRTEQRCEELGLPIGAEEIAARLLLLRQSDRIEAFGDLRKWYHSEIRLKE